MGMDPLQDPQPGIHRRWLSQIEVEPIDSQLLFLTLIAMTAYAVLFGEVSNRGVRIRDRLGGAHIPKEDPPTGGNKP